MSDAWKQLDLGGAGLQEVNRELAAQLRNRKQAFVRLLAFPLGLHRDYLRHPLGAWLYRGVFAAALIAYFVLRRPCIGGGLLVLLTLAALYDLRWIDDRVASLNKQLRLQAFRSRPSTAPRGFRGRMTDESADTGLDDWISVKNRERGGHVLPGADPAFNSTSRAPSIAQQEAMLRELARGTRTENSTTDRDTQPK
ncbi:MAG: TM2 domain-containing protein [Betaproteobacteria bacterium]|nr:TM2 domain-containing protein [Betaproteobacteria bacterium]